jgi:hypothetical protein
VLVSSRPLASQPIDADGVSNLRSSWLDWKHAG